MRSVMFRFQFQIGAIKSATHLATSCTVEFQFQIGAIKSIVAQHGMMKRICFNSKLVRLEDKIVTAIPDGIELFQFQTGSIRRSIMPPLTIGLYEFQFQTGSIRRLSKNYINIILDPYSSCQVNFYFYQI